MPCLVTMHAGKAHVWDPEDVLWLRKQCRTVGALIGQAADRQARSATGGLPCELTPEELKLALAKGWVTTQRDVQESAVLPGQAVLKGTLETGTDVEVTPPVKIKTAVFTDLHDKGYYVTDGAKFGAEYLLYPGDPVLFHAQFTVQPMHQDQNIAPNLLLGSARGSHAARKHLLLASGSAENLFYITMAPEDGFGSKAQH